MYTIELLHGSGTGDTDYRCKVGEHAIHHGSVRLTCNHGSLGHVHHKRHACKGGEGLCLMIVLLCCTCAGPGDALLRRGQTCL